MTPGQIEQHRRECEAKHVLALPFVDRAQYLVEEIHKQHKLRKVAA